MSIKYLLYIEIMRYITFTRIEIIPDKQAQRTILYRIKRLAEELDEQGKMLTKELPGFRNRP